MKNFVLTGASGYIAPRHMKAIKETKNNLIAAFDPYDGIGIMDNYFPEAYFFTEYELFESFIQRYQRSQNEIEYVSIASPNYLHYSHIRSALKGGSNAICEKPLVLNPKEIDELLAMEKQSGKKVYTVLQLRLHDSIVALKKKVADALKQNTDKTYDIDLTYIASRGRWYFSSWKGDEAKSGGIASNIGIHFFDMLCWVFGDIKESVVHVKQADTNAGYIRLRNANVRWFLSVNRKYLPKALKAAEQTTYRSISVDGEEIEFSKGFEDLHTKSYRDILAKGGFSIQDARPSIDIVSSIRGSTPVGLKGAWHPFCKKVLYG